MLVEWEIEAMLPIDLNLPALWNYAVAQLTAYPSWYLQHALREIF